MKVAASGIWVRCVWCVPKRCDDSRMQKVGLNIKISIHDAGMFYITLTAWKCTKIKWSGWIIFNSCFQTLKKSSSECPALQSQSSQPVLQLALMPIIDLETLLLQEKKSLFCGSSKLLKKCLLLKWAQHRVSNTICKGSILILKWIIKDYTGCRARKTTTHVIRWCFTLQSHDFTGQRKTCYNACMPGACFCPYSWSTALVYGRAEGWKESNSQWKLTLVNKEMSSWRRSMFAKGLDYFICGAEDPKWHPWGEELLSSKSKYYRVSELYRVAHLFLRKTTSEGLKNFSCNLMAGLSVESEDLLIYRRGKRNVSQWEQHFVWKTF